MNNAKLVIPNCNEFMSIYGFDCEIDDAIQTVKFVNGDERVTLSFDLTVNSVRLLFYRKDCIVVDLYLEGLSELYLDENGNYLSFKFSNGLHILIKLYPQINITGTTLL